MEYQCDTCSKIFTSKQSLTYHVSHKVCNNSSKKCEKCGYIFKSVAMLKYHNEHDVCDKKDRVPEIIMKPKITLKAQSISDYSKYTKEQLIHDLVEIKGKYESIKDNPQTINNNKINIIVPPAFLKVDNYQQINQSIPHLLHEALSKHPANFISYMIKKTNCNPQLPLYNSIKMTNKKDQFVQISDGMKYVHATKKKVIGELIENKRQTLQKYVDNNGDKYGEKILNKYQNYIDFLDDNKEAQKELEMDIICMLLNISELIGSDEWTKKLLADLKTYEDYDDK